jgi:hypothetical protein
MKNWQIFAGIFGAYAVSLYDGHNLIALTVWFVMSLAVATVL